MKKNTELDLFPRKSFVFKGQTLKTGDVLSFKLNKSGRKLVAAFTHVDDDGYLNTFSTLLVYSGKHLPDEISELRILRSGQDSISEESRNPALKYGENIVEINSSDKKRMKGVLLASFDGIVAAWSPELGFISGGSMLFKPAN